MDRFRVDGGINLRFQARQGEVEVRSDIAWRPRIIQDLDCPPDKLSGLRNVAAASELSRHFILPARAQMT